MSKRQPSTGASELSIRQRQKLETQRKLLRAARALGVAGKVPSIADVAKSAGVSVATAYRYYSDPRRLQSDAALDQSLDGGQPDFVGVFEQAVAEVSDPLARLLIAQRQMMGSTIANEAAYRLFVAKGHEEMVRSGLKRNNKPAGGRRVMMIEAALKDLRPQMTATAWRDMVLSLMIVMGPEPFFVLTDFASLPEDKIWPIVERTISTVLAAHQA